MIGLHILFALILLATLSTAFRLRQIGAASFRGFVALDDDPAEIAIALLGMLAALLLLDLLVGAVWLGAVL